MSRQVSVAAFLSLALASFVVFAQPKLGSHQVEASPSELAAGSSDEGAMVVLDGRIRLDANVFYHLANLRQGQTLSVHVRGTSGNLDPFVALVDGHLDDETLDQRLTEFHQGVTGREDLLTALPAFANELFLAWDDDGGDGYAAAFARRIPADGDYQLLVVASPGSGTFGDFRLLIGLEAPEVLSGEAVPRGRVAVTRDTAAARPERAVQAVDGVLDAGQRERVIPLEDVRAGDKLSVHIEATSGNLLPALTLEDFGGKPVRSALADEAAQRATLSYAFPESESNYRLRVRAEGDTAGAYRLTIGLNAPEVVLGDTEPGGRQLIAQPTEVQIGIRLDQITEVDQRSENFGVVADLRMIWRDPRLAFSPDSCRCATRLMPIADFFGYAQERGARWPDFSLFNQQGRRWGQGEVVELAPDGRAVYAERFSATLQAPDFDFRRYPFDQQTFFIRLVSLFPETEYVYTVLPGFSRLGEQLGEEEWLTASFATQIDSVDGHARFSYVFEAERHLTYYVVRIFLPVLLIILVSWFVFFLQDYGKRIDLAGANLLLFIAFNFTISSDLPRLGYLTFLDTILVGTFLITGLVLAFNVYLRRLEVTDRVARAHALDRYTLWIYPAGYLVTFAVLGWLYLR